MHTLIHFCTGILIKHWKKWEWENEKMKILGLFKNKASHCQFPWFLGEKNKRTKKRNMFVENLIGKNKKIFKELMITVRNGPTPSYLFMLLNCLNKSFDASNGMNWISHVFTWSYHIIEKVIFFCLGNEQWNCQFGNSLLNSLGINQTIHSLKESEYLVI